jgi:flagellar assembly protein FliH
LREGFKKMTVNSDFVPFSLLVHGEDGQPQTIDPFQQRRKEAARLMREAEEILQKARQQAAEIEKQAYDKGLAEGRDKGESEGRRQYEEILTRFDQLMAAVEGQRAQIQGQYEKELLPLIIAMVDKLVQHEISVNNRVIASCLRNTMQFVADSAMVRVYLHPDDFIRIKEVSLNNPELLGSRKQLDLVEDDTVAIGGCYIRSDFGEVDASLENFRNRLYQTVEKAFLAALAEPGN